MDNEFKFRKIAILENWFGIDEILFHSRKIKECLSEADHKKFLKNKATLMLNTYEIYNELGYTPKRKYKSNKHLMEVSTKHGFICLKNAIKFIKENFNSDEFLTECEAFSESTEISKNLAKKIVAKKRILAVAIDGFMLESAINNVQCNICLNSPKMKTLLDANKKLRDRMIDSVLKYV